MQPMLHHVEISHVVPVPTTLNDLLQRTLSPRALSVVFSPLNINEYTPDGLPEGYQTVLGYYKDTNPEAFEWLYSPVENMQDDEDWCKAIMNNREELLPKLQAPSGYRKLGVNDVYIFPKELLKERIG